MASQQHLDKMRLRQNYRNLWHTDLTSTIQADPPLDHAYLTCSVKGLYNDMSRYTCCAGYMPCSGRCGESKCPEFCLATETQHKVEMDKRDGKFGPQPMVVPPVQQMSRLGQPYPPTVGYPPPAYGQYTGYPPPQAQGYPAAGYPPPGYPPAGYPPAGYQDFLAVLMS